VQSDNSWLVCEKHRLGHVKADILMSRDCSRLGLGEMIIKEVCHWLYFYGPRSFSNSVNAIWSFNCLRFS
jgi:hypothetical protein